MKRICYSMLVILAGVLFLTGCQFRASLGIGNFVNGESYPDAEQYKTGNFTYKPDQVKAVEIYWRSGEVELIESDAAELRANESGGELSEDIAMHYFLDDGVLRIRFCESGALVEVNENDKRLSIEVPKNIDVSVHTTSALVQADTLEQNNLLIATLSGSTELGTVKAENIDLSSSSGSIGVSELGGETFKCNATSGSIFIDHMSVQTFKCRTTSGSVAIDNAVAGMNKIETTSGSVDLILVQNADTAVYTTSGTVELQLARDGAEVLYQSNSGRVYADSGYQMKGDLYVFGSGKGKVTVETTSGNLKIRT